jgi:predicted Zn finger-like uncharacterized protein
MNVRCPQCQAAYALGDNLAGANIRCKVCQTVFLAAPAAAPPAPAEAVRPSAGAPARPGAAAPRRAEVPPRRRESMPLRRPSEEGSSTGLILGIIGGLAALLFLGIGLVVVLVVVLSSRESRPTPAIQIGGNPGQFGGNPGQGGGKGGTKVIPGDTYVYIQQCVQDKRLSDVDVRGFQTNRPFREAPALGAILIGFQVGLTKFIDNDVIDALRPIYLTRNGEVMGQWFGKQPANPITVKAKAGYVVSAINIRTGLLIDGFSLKFARLGQGQLQLDDNYESGWVGGPGGGPDTIGGNGLLFVGVCGSLNDGGAPCALGLITVMLPP